MLTLIGGEGPCKGGNIIGYEISNSKSLHPLLQISSWSYETVNTMNHTVHVVHSFSILYADVKPWAQWITRFTLSHVLNILSSVMNSEYKESHDVVQIWIKWNSEGVVFTKRCRTKRTKSVKGWSSQHGVVKKWIKWH